MNKRDAVSKGTLTNFNNKDVILKLTSGRAISGLLREVDGVFTLQLGIQHLVIEENTVAKVTETPKILQLA